ncbi:MAG TPA: hypothetical protein VFS63_13655 [Pseudolabrys sp.]|jgi:hypothetical protein|nr:hypothetical protein [Pseudolabrys sp.]
MALYAQADHIALSDQSSVVEGQAGLRVSFGRGGRPRFHLALNARPIVTQSLNDIVTEAFNASRVPCGIH